MLKSVIYNSKKVQNEIEIDVRVRRIQARNRASRKINVYLSTCHLKNHLS